MYVDKIAAKSPEINEKMKTALSQKFDVKDLGELHYFLGVQVAPNHNRGTV